MRKLKIVLTVMLALCVSLALFACGETNEDKTAAVVGVTIGNQLELTESDTSDTVGGKKGNLQVTVTYDDGTTAALGAEDWDFTEDSLKNVKFGTIGSYVVQVQPNKNNDRHYVGDATIVIDHAWGAADENGVQSCATDGATKTTTQLTEAEAIKVEFDGYHDTDFAKLGKDGSRIRPFGKTTSGQEPHTATVGRLEKGMTIKVRGKMIATSQANPYYFPIIGLANRQTDAGFVVRNDGWGIYGGIGGGGLLAASGLSDQTITAGTPDASTTDWMAYFEGAGSASADFATEQDVELSWRFVENKADDNTVYCVVELGFYNYTINRSYTVRVKVPNRQFYDTVLHGEEVEMTFTQITVIQDLNLENIESAKIKADAKNTYLENEMFDFSTVDVQAKFKQDAAGTTRPFEVFELYASTDATPTDATEWKYNLENDKLSKDMKSYKLILTVGEEVREHVFTATEFPITIKENAVDNANANDVKIGEEVFTANQLGDIAFTQGTGTTAQLTLAGNALSLSATQKAALDTTKTHYVAFSVYQNGLTKFAGTTPVFTGTEGYAAIRENGTALDVVLALSADVKTVTLAGVNGQNILVDVSGMTSYTHSTVEAGNVYLNKAGTVKVTYDLKVDPAGAASDAYAPADVRIAVGNSRVVLNTAVENGAWKAEAVNVVRDGSITAKVTSTATQLTVEYTFTADAAKPASYDMQLFTRESGTWTQQASDIVYPTFAFAENGEGTTGYYVADKDVYAFVDGTTLYLAVARAHKNMVTSYNAVRGTLGIALNAGAKTPAEYKLALYTGKQDLSYVVNNLGEVVFTNSSPVDGLISGEFVTFGTLDNAKDSDRGAFLLIKIDASKLGYTSSDSFSFELDPDTDPSDGLAGTYYTYNATTKAFTATAYTVAQDATATALNTNGNCALATSKAYEVKAGNDTVFYAGAYETYEGEHTWSTEKNADGFYACETCGSLKTYKGDETEPVAANDTAIPALGETLPDTGLTVFFTLGTTTSDWGSQALVTKEGNMIITLPNLDPWNNNVAEMADATAREKELAGKVASANCFPAGENLFNGGTWDVFLNREDSPRVAISISKTFGISYYLNGELKVSYPASKAVGSGTVSEVAELFLSLTGRKGLTLNAGNSTPMSNVMLIKAGYDATKVKEIYDAEQPAAAATALVQTIDNAPATRDASTLPSATNQVEIGTAAHDLSFTAQNPVWRYTIQPGQKIVLKGTMTSSASAATDSNFHNAIMNTFSSSFHAFFRCDNWAGNADLTQGVNEACVTDGSTITDYAGEFFGDSAWWAGAREIFKNCKVEFTFDATGIFGDVEKDGVCGGEFVMIFKATSATNDQEVFISTATFTLKEAQSWWVTEGQSWGGLTIGIGGEKCHIVLNASEVTPE